MIAILAVTFLVMIEYSSLCDYNYGALFYGALLEAAAFMKEDPDTVTQYTARYSEVMQLLKNLGDGKNRRDAYRSGQERIPVRNG